VLERPGRGDRLVGINPLLADKTAPLPLSQKLWRPERYSDETDASGAWNAQVLADLAHQQLFDFVVPGYGTAPVELGLLPSGVVAAFSQHSAAVLAQMARYVSALQRASASSS